MVAAGIERRCDLSTLAISRFLHRVAVTGIAASDLPNDSSHSLSKKKTSLEVQDQDARIERGHLRGNVRPYLASWVCSLLVCHGPRARALDSDRESVTKLRALPGSLPSPYLCIGDLPPWLMTFASYLCYKPPRMSGSARFIDIRHAGGARWSDSDLTII